MRESQMMSRLSQGTYEKGQEWRNRDLCVSPEPSANRDCVSLLHIFSISDYLTCVISLNIFRENQ